MKFDRLIPVMIENKAKYLIAANVTISNGILISTYDSVIVSVNTVQ